VVPRIIELVPHDIKVSVNEQNTQQSKVAHLNNHLN